MARSTIFRLVFKFLAFFPITNVHDCSPSYLPSDGDKIICNKANRKRKRSVSAEQSGRSIIVSAYEEAVNTGEEEPIRKYMEQYCNPTNCVMHIDMTALYPSSPVPIFREIRGIPAIVSYLHIGIQASPDLISLFWQKNVKKHEDGSRDIHCECHVVGKRVYDIEVVKDKSFDQHQEELETAISGLAALASGQVDQPPPAPSVLSSAAMLESPTVTSVETMKMFVADGNVRFRRGSKLRQQVEINHAGTFVWSIDANNKITTMKFAMK